ncbi:MAG: preprotein translocase subunit SecG [Christensenellales bacterium]|jgi:preprotein translocase subunit SecG
MYEVYVGLMIACMSVMVLLSIGMIIIVSLQSGQQANLGAITGAAESFFGKNKAKTMDAKFKRITIFIAIAMLIVSILFFIFYLLKNAL